MSFWELVVPFLTGYIVGAVVVWISIVELSTRKPTKKIDQEV